MIARDFLEKIFKKFKKFIVKTRLNFPENSFYPDTKFCYFDSTPVRKYFKVLQNSALMHSQYTVYFILMHYPGIASEIILM